MHESSSPFLPCDKKFDGIGLAKVDKGRSRFKTFQGKFGTATIASKVSFLGDSSVTGHFWHN